MNKNFLSSMLMSSLLVSFLAMAVPGVVAPDGGTPHKLEFVFVVPSYNNAKYARRNLESLIHQNTQNPYSIIVINDCSTDSTGALLETFKKEHNLSDSFLKIIHNPHRKGALANIYNTIHTRCKDHQIVVLVDGDDAVAHNNVLTRLEQEYANPDVWMSYGQFIFFPSAEWGTTYEIPREALEQRKVRTLIYVAQHLRTFKAALFKKIKREHLMKEGTFFAMNADMAIMIPMLEMAAPIDEFSQNHSVFIPDILCIYTYDNPLNDHVVNRALQLELEEVIRAFKPYEPLERL